MRLIEPYVTSVRSANGLNKIATQHVMWNLKGLFQNTHKKTAINQRKKLSPSQLKNKTKQNNFDFCIKIELQLKNFNRNT